MHQLKFERLEVRENDNSMEEGIKLCTVEMTTPFKPFDGEGIGSTHKGPEDRDERWRVYTHETSKVSVIFL